MKRWVRRLAAPLLVLVLSAPLAACGEGNGVNCVQSPALQLTVCI